MEKPICHWVRLRLSSDRIAKAPRPLLVDANVATSRARFRIYRNMLAPGWVHGCLGLWLGLRGYAPAYRAKPLLVAVFVTLPLLSAAGFFQMKRAVIAASLNGLVPDASLVQHRAALDGWRHDLLIAYLLLIVTAFAAGQLRNGFDKHVSRKAAGDA